MNNFFCAIVEDLASNIDDAPNPLLSDGFTERRNSIRFKFRQIGVQDIRDAIAKINTSKTFGNDNISCYFLKLALPVIENSLVSLFNTSIQTCLLPDPSKLASHPNFQRR